jgi:hypothetical protein
VQDADEPVGQAPEGVVVPDCRLPRCSLMPAAMVELIDREGAPYVND